MTQSTSNLPGTDTNTTPTRTRADNRDYLIQPSATVALLPSIAEEKNGNGHSIPYHKSISLVDSSRFGLSPYDGSDKEVYNFVQLDVLSGGGELEIGNRIWKETSRFIKYEEQFEEGSDRWGKAHISSLSFEALSKLRHLIERDGHVMLEMAEKDLPGVAYRVVEELSGKGIIRQEESPLLMRALLLKHKHVVQDTEKGWFGLRRTNTASVASLQSLFDDKSRSRSILPTTDPCVLVRRNSAIQHKSSIHEISSSAGLQRTASGNYLRQASEMSQADPMKRSSIDQSTTFVSEEDLKWYQRKDAIRRLLPHGAESTMIMVGDFDWLRKPIFVFVRLAEPSLMYNVTEIVLPVTFFAFLLSSQNIDLDLIETGRSLGALMSNKHFYEVALFAMNRKNLLTGINEFLECSLVLPPGDWHEDDKDLLPLHVLQAKSKAIRQRRVKKEQAGMTQSMSYIGSSESFCDATNGGLVMKSDDIDNKKRDRRDPLKRTGRLFGGVINDLQRRLPHLKSDYTDAFNFQCLSCTIFMYFASIGLIVTFAGLMGEKSANLIGMSEVLLGTALSGVLYSLVSIQPLIPIGPTGPLLVFDGLLFGFCKRYDVEFLPMRIWIAIWSLIFTTICVALEGSVLVKWFTRFTQDIFACLTSLLLLLLSIDNIIEVYEEHPLAVPKHDTRQISLTINTTHYSLVFEETTTPTPFIDETEELTKQPNTALLCTILMFGTFLIAYFLREFRNSVFLGEKARRLLGDFSIPIALLTMVALDYYEDDTYTQKVKVPEGFNPSSPEERGWFINPMGMEKPFPPIYMLAAAAPAILIFILMFMSMEICELLLAAKEKKLVKGSGFHWDLWLISVINMFSGFFGGPWLCCAAVRAIAHLNALTVYSTNLPPGQKPELLGVMEQRLTNLTLSILIGISILMAPVLAYIPVSVLYGVFFYVGVSSLGSTQLYDRFQLLFIPVKSHPSTTIYVRRLKTWKMHAYTFIQIACICFLFAIKSWKAISLFFPFFLVLLVPIRLSLKRFYTENELEALDGDPAKVK